MTIDRKTTNSLGNSDFKKTSNIEIGSNVLNSYRSITYNFTLAGLPVNYLNDPEAYRQGELNLVILKSGGKGNSSINGIAPTATTLNQNYSPTQDVISGFNKFSPGKFDFFIENVEIETLMTFTNNSNSTLPTKIKFEIIEPYSVNGFIETLHVAAIAAGYTTYVNASYLLKLEFWGYPDDDVEDFKLPVKIPNSERYFAIGFTDVNVEITEKGTKYECSAVPFNERAFGQPSVLKKPIKMTGITVKQILDNFIEELNSQIKKSNEDIGITNGYDSYEIIFKERKAGIWQPSPENIIAKSPLLELYEDNVLYKFAQPNSGQYKRGSKPKTINPNSAVVNFQEGSNVHDVITAVIRDSKYVRDLLSDLADEKNFKSRIDVYGFVEYFLVSVETRNKKEIDNNTKRPFQIFSYVITPYKVHFTRIPTYGNIQLKEEELKLFALREYNYIYTGKNLDIINFKLNFNTLYFEAIPVSMGYQKKPNFKDSSSPANDSKPLLSGMDPDVQKQNSTHGPHPIQTVPANVQGTGGTAVPIQNSPYFQLARNMHEAIINSKSSMITGSIDILGDPFYLVTGGIGNYNPKETGKFGVVGNNEADRSNGEVNIAINFRNPIDINTFESGGLMYFDPNRVAFSGVYMVTSVKSFFKNGSFTQTLDIIRKPGQILKEETDKKIIDVADLYKTVPNNENRISQSSSNAIPVSYRADSTFIRESFNRGYPTSELPGANSSTPGLLGGSSAGTLPQSYGVVNAASQLQSNAGVIGESLPTQADLLSNIRINQTELSNINQSVYSSAALINSAVNILTGNKSAKNVLSTLAGNVIGTTISKTLNRFNVGSGIGEGKTVSIFPKDILDSQLTSNDIKFGNNINEIINPSNIINNVASIGANAISAVNRLGAEAEKLVGNIGENINKSLGSLSDPSAVAARLGIDSAKLSGLSSNLQSKISKQISDISSKIPENLDLKQAVNSGLALTSIPVSKYQNIPPTSSIKTEESVLVSQGNNISQITNPLKSLKYYTNSVDETVVKDKINSAKIQISKITGSVNVVDQQISNSVSSVFGSKSSKLDPLKKLLGNS